MNNSDEYISTLSELGLSNIQARVYLALAKSSNLKAQEISSISGVARPDVYRVLVQLEEAGLVERIISKPEEFRALPIENCVSNLFQRRILKTAELQQKAIVLMQGFKRDAAKEEQHNEFQFILLPSRDIVYSKAEKMIRNAQEIICFFALRKRLLAWISNYFPVLEEALNRNVDFRVILPIPEANKRLDEPIEALLKHPNFVVRFRSGSFNVGFSVWDRKEMLLSTSATDTPFPHPTLWSNNKSIVALAQEHFDSEWQKAQKTKIVKRKTIMDNSIVV